MSDQISIIEDGMPTPVAKTANSVKPWKILVVDDDQEVLNVTRFILDDLVFLDRPVKLLYATSAGQARTMLGDHRDLAVAILDVVMETDRAGLDLKRYIREESQLAELRIILRTGQPGYAPELSVIREYDINDYRMKSELTQTRLITSIVTALRSYDQLYMVSEYRKGLELIIRAASDLLEQPAVAGLAEGVLTQMAALLKLSPEGILFVQRPFPCGADPEGAYIVAAAGDNAELIGQPVERLPERRVAELIRSCLEARRHQFTEYSTVLFLQATDHQDAAIFMNSPKPLADLDKRLLDVFVANIAACYRNVKLVERLNYDTYHDQLTGLSNRQALVERLQGAQGSDHILTLVDLVHFSDINDGLGPDFGDALLRAVGSRLAKTMPDGVQVSRIGADLFGVFGSDADVSPHVITEAFQEPFDIDGYHVPLSSHIGINRSLSAPNNGSQALKRANIALNLSKQQGPDHQVAFDPAMEAAIRERVRIIGELRQAIQDRQLAVWYQPQIDFASGKAVGAEALLRWPRAGGFAWPPSVFIPLAEYSGLIGQIGLWVLNEACRQQRVFAASGSPCIRVAVNVSMPQFWSDDFLEQVAAAIRGSAIDPACLELEITESLAMDNFEHVRERIDALRSMGITIAIDDFGTGFSSLGQLKNLPIDYLKIDRSFVTDIACQKDAGVAETIIALSKKLNMRTIAEGIENDEQASILHAMGCDIAQGYYYGKPMSADQLALWLETRR